MTRFGGFSKTAQLSLALVYVVLYLAPVFFYPTNGAASPSHLHVLLFHMSLCHTLGSKLLATDSTRETGLSLEDVDIN